MAQQGVVTGEYPGQFLGLFAHTNTTTSTQENLISAPLKLNTEAFAGSANPVGSSLHSGNGTPQGNLAAGAGSFYLRYDTPSTPNQRIYVCTVGGSTPGTTTWSGIV